MEKQPDTIGTPGEHGTEREASATVHGTYTPHGFTKGSLPKRIQRLRKKGWKMPPGAVAVDRSTRFGNPWRVSAYLCAFDAVDAFRHFVTGPEPEDEWLAKEWHGIVDNLESLRGKDLACWCSTKWGTVCHADVLLELANAPQNGESNGSSK